MCNMSTPTLKKKKNFKLTIAEVLALVGNWERNTCMALCAWLSLSLCPCSFTFFLSAYCLIKYVTYQPLQKGLTISDCLVICLYIVALGIVNI